MNTCLRSAEYRGSGALRACGSLVHALVALADVEELLVAATLEERQRVGTLVGLGVEERDNFHRVQDNPSVAL